MYLYGNRAAGLIFNFTMKLFITKLFLFFLPILLLGATIEIALRKIPNDYLYKKNYLDKNASTLEVLFLGNSHFYYGINPKFLQKKSFNAAFVSQSIDFDLEILKKYETSFKKLEYIVIPIDYLSLYFSLSKSTESWRVKNYNLYYGINYNYTISDNSEIFSNKMTLNFDRLQSFYLNKMSSITCTNLGWGTSNNSKNAQNLVTSGKAAAERHLGKDPEIFVESVQSLTEIVNFAIKNNTKIVLISSPAYPTYVRNLDKKQLAKTIEIATKMDQEHKNVVYLNWMQDTSFVAKDFFDADHLNEIGAEKLTKKIDAFLESKTF